MRKKKLISKKHREQYRLLHKQKPIYGATSSRKWIKSVYNLYNELNAKTILDYGCGKGALKKGLLKAGLSDQDIFEYDPAIEGKEDKRPADLIVCTDVMEHVEEEFVDNVLQDISSLMGKAAFFVIFLSKARYHLPNGENCHCTVKPKVWWLDRVKENVNANSFETRNSDNPYELIIEVRR